MSLSWRSTSFRVHLAADALMACEVHARRGRRCVVRKLRLPFIGGERPAAMQSLRDWMAQGKQNAWPRRTSQEWVLGMAHVRYLLLPWTPDLADTAFRSTLASALFEQQFKQDPADYGIRFASPTYGRAQLAAFVTHALLAEIDAHTLASRVPLRSAMPALSPVWDRFHAVLHNESGAVHLVDGDRQLVVRHVQGRMRDVTLRPFEAGHAESLPSAEDAGMRRRVFPAMSMSDAASDDALLLADVDGFSAAQDAAYAFALCGVA